MKTVIESVNEELQQSINDARYTITMNDQKDLYIGRFNGEIIASNTLPVRIYKACWEHKNINK